MTTTPNPTPEQIIAQALANLDARQIEMEDHREDARVIAHDLRAHGLLTEGAPTEEQIDAVVAEMTRLRSVVAWWASPDVAEALIRAAALTAAGVAPQEPSEQCGNTIAPVNNGGKWGCCTKRDGHEPPCIEDAALAPDREKLGGEGVPIIEYAESVTSTDPVSQMAVLLMTAWGKGDRNSGVSKYPASYIATFVDMARAVLVAPVAVDEAKLAEVMDGVLVQCSARMYVSGKSLAAAAIERRAEWLRGEQHG